MNPGFSPAAYSAVVATASFTPAAAAYSAGDTMDVAKELSWRYAASGVLVPPRSVVRILTSTLKIDTTAVISGETSYTLHLYSVTPPSALADNAIWTLASADLPSYCGSLSLGTIVDLGAALFVKTGGHDNDVNLAGSELFGSLVTVGAFTATAIARQVTLIGMIV